jgi:hypothetical protein
MSYSPLTSDDDSIRTLLRRLDANPRIDEEFRTDPLEVLREARMKVAARARAGGGGTEGILAEDDNGALTSPAAGADSPGDVGQTSILLPAEIAGKDEDEPGEEANHGALIVIEAVEEKAPNPLNGRLLMAGAGLAVCSALAVALGSILFGGPGTGEVEQASLAEPKPSETVLAKNVTADPPAREGVARFTVSALNFADLELQEKLDPAIAEISARDAVKPQPVKVATTTRLEVSAGDQVALPIELSPARGTGEVAAIVLRGLPKDYSVVAALPSGDGSWVLSPDALKTARIVVPDAEPREVSVTAELFDMSAQVVGTPRFVLATRPAIAAENHDSQQARDMLARGHDKLRAGDVAEARSLFKLAAERGVPEGAFALGETFDPAQAAARGAAEQKGDPDLARFWYEYASQRGVAAARERLAALNDGT